MTPEQLAMTPSSLSPNGVYNLANPHNEGKSAIIATGAVLMSIMLVFAGIRYHVKFFVQRKVTPDDGKRAHSIPPCMYLFKLVTVLLAIVSLVFISYVSSFLIFTSRLELLGTMAHVFAVRSPHVLEGLLLKRA
jgi:hypothetical protein